MAATVGRLLRLRGVVRRAQVVSRISATWGNRLLLATAVPRIVQSFVDWGMQVAAEENGVYRAGAEIAFARRGMASWLLTALRAARASDRC